MQVKYRDFQRHYALFKDECLSAIDEVLKEGEFILGSAVKRFENEFSTYLKVKYCIGVASGTDALEMAIEALKLPPQSEILVPANSFIATAEAVTRSGHKVVFADCHPKTYCLSIESLKKNLTSKTKAVIPVHLFGQPCDMDIIMEWAKAHDLRVIEDCSHAHGAEYKGKKVGGFGDIATFSFNPWKNLGAFGDGGAIVTNRDDLAEYCELLRNHGRTGRGNHLFEGRNSRLDTIQAAILSVKLKHLEGWIERRRELAASYEYLLGGREGAVLPVSLDNVRHVYHIFNVKFEQRDLMLRYFKHYQVGCSIHYQFALPELKAYSYLQQNCSDYVAIKENRSFISLPLNEYMTDEELVYVSEVVKTCLDSAATTG